LNKRRLIILSFSLICLALIIGGFVYWLSGKLAQQKEQWAEQKLQEYIGRLKDDYDYIFEERSLTEFHKDDVLEVYWFSDFRSIARHVNASYIYVDREIQCLYFLSGVSGENANVFYYNRVF